MPFKHHEPNRHHIPKARYKVTNWPEYDRGLVQRGDIRFWNYQEALEGWIAPYRTTHGDRCRVLEPGDRDHADPWHGLSAAPSAMRRFRPEPDDTVEA